MTNDSDDPELNASQGRSVSAIIICTDRLAETIDCLTSLLRVEELLLEVLLLKNAPKEPWPEEVLNTIPASIRSLLTIIDSDVRVFPTLGRNLLVKQAAGSVYMFLDDDSVVLSSEGILEGLRILNSDSTVGSIAFPQSQRDGTFDPAGQPAPVDYTCFTCGFMTCGALVKASVYRQLNGFQELLQIQHEENEFCRRQWDAGFSVVYVPLPCICHCPTPTARNVSQRFKFNARNSLYLALLHEPWYLLVFTFGPRAFLAIRYLKQVCPEDWKGLCLQSGQELRADLTKLLKVRRPLKWTTLRKWQSIKKTYPAYTE